MNETVKVTFSIDWDLLKEFDNLINKKGLENRSKIIRDLIEDFIITEKLKQNKWRDDAQGSYLLILVSDSPINTEIPIGVTIQTKKDSYLTLIILKRATHKEAENKIREIKSHNTLTFYRIVQILDNDK